ncbi:HNH endonuclease [Rubripirellula obstinata]|uniref:HNH endonuclease n=1 Tax=Rubripirellula obstinata TaxID=406547 RepID=A0A5B1CF64_9BACT|nr:HNH endonuclease [Rubripirellula obstinata]KAA1257964.1 HNH endonuclease [Rubripirellula obstinata]
MSEYVPVDLRRRVRDAFFSRCAYCQTDEALTVAIFEIEHITPVSLDGQTEFDNLCLACSSYSRFKSNRTHGTTDAGLECRLFYPQQDSWLEHFDWTINGTVIVGVTDVGIQIAARRRSCYNWFERRRVSVWVDQDNE